MVEVKGILLLLWIAVLCPNFTWAQTTSEVWPELNVYSKLNEQFRLRLAAGITRSQEFENKTDVFLEVDLDIGIKKAFNRKAIFRDVERNKLLTLRVGYAYVPSFAEEGSNENRAILEVTNRFVVPGDLHLNDRNRLDFRWIDGENSIRYRNRLKLEREFSVRNFHFNTYAHTEFYYDTRSD
ncbi:DUF2490 domain-containing protein, partial [bacterium]|nr:DUF2490 domain-containing protein [bacterium]